MRRLLLLFALTSLFACGDGVDRLSGDGCQPACQTPAVDDDADGQRALQCLDEGHEPTECIEGGEGTVVCPGGGVPACGDDGPPVCPNGATPYCAL